MSTAVDTKEPEAMDYDYIVKNRERLVEEAAPRAKHVVKLVIRDVEHYVNVVNYFSDNISKDRKDWGFTTLPLSDLANGANGAATEVFIFKQMDDEFDDKAISMFLSLK